MAYHDETTAQRLTQLCRFLDDHAADIPATDRSQLAALATTTAELLLTDDFHAGSNNHGMFQDLALLRFAAGNDEWLVQRPLTEVCVETAISRLVAYFTKSFTPDGVHVENSPGYHLMVSRSLRDVIPLVGSVDSSRAGILEEIYECAEKFAVHSVMPDGAIAPLGDTKVIPIRKSRHKTTFPGAHFAYAISGGRGGQASSERSAVFATGGYAIHRTAWGDPAAYVMTFKAAYLAQYHHHCDDLALTVFGRGHWLLSEAGPYGYDYQSPLTKYAYSQYAHNVVVVDGRSLPRVDQEPGGVHMVDRLAEPPPTPPCTGRSGLRGLLGRRRQAPQPNPVNH